MTTLIKRNRNLEKSIISDKGEIEISPAGVIIRFPQPDGRKPSYSVHLDEATIKTINDTAPASEAKKPYFQWLKPLEKLYFEKLMKITDSNQSKISKIACLNRGTVRKKLKQYGLI